uniref:Uncharacterized protein n=1 Tax=Cyanothece sp. (strain PCC 7425 / ATCC 29141) TaxID=395961 RepID=B8HVT7_CYAP4
MSSSTWFPRVNFLPFLNAWLSSLLGLALPLLLLPSPLRAQTLTGFKTASGELAVVGFQPRQKVPVTYPAIPRVRNLKANDCGVIAVTDTLTWPASPTTLFRINNRTIQFGAITIANIPKCSKTGKLSAVMTEPRRKGTDVYVAGFPANAAVAVTYVNLPTVRNITANACGILVIKPTPEFPSSRVNINSLSLDPVTLPLKMMPQCKEGVIYYPEGWKR